MTALEQGATQGETPLFGGCVVLPVIMDGVFSHVRVPPAAEDHGAVVLFVNDNYGRKPVALLLPHQITLERLARVLKEHPGASCIEAIPIDTSDAVAVWRR